MVFCKKKLAQFLAQLHQILTNLLASLWAQLHQILTEFPATLAECFICGLAGQHFPRKVATRTSESVCGSPFMVGLFCLIKRVCGHCLSPLSTAIVNHRPPSTIHHPPGWNAHHHHHRPQPPPTTTTHPSPTTHHPPIVNNHPPPIVNLQRNPFSGILCQCFL